MTAIVAADFTVVITDISLVGRKRHVFGTIAFGDGALTYTTAGIAMPALAKFGFLRQMDAISFFGINARTSDYLYRWVKSTNKLQLFEESDAGVTTLPEADGAEAPAARTLNFEAWGW